MAHIAGIDKGPVLDWTVGMLQEMEEESENSVQVHSTLPMML